MEGHSKKAELALAIFPLIAAWLWQMLKRQCTLFKFGGKDRGKNVDEISDCSEIPHAKAWQYAPSDEGWP